jgi:hypothetical protein
MATSAPAGAVSLANPASPRTAPGPEDWNAGPSSWARQAASSGSRRTGTGAAGPSADSAASTMVCQPVHRQRWAARAERTEREPAAPARGMSRMRMPGVQKPHWLAPAATKASAQRSRSSGSTPSRVVTERPATRRAGVTQATRGRPSTQTVQQPHWPWGLQPSLTERQEKRWRRRSSSELSSSSAATGSPFRVKRRRPGRPGGPCGAWLS